MTQPELQDARTPGFWDTYTKEFDRMSRRSTFGLFSPEREKVFRDVIGRLFVSYHEIIEPSEPHELSAAVASPDAILQELEVLWAQEEDSEIR